MRRRKYIFVWTMLVVFLFSVLTGCTFETTNKTKIKDLEYTICDESRLPDALVQIIREKRKEPFKLTYRTKDYLYIVVGYGAQDRVDLGVAMNELYLTENAIFVDTDLISKETTTLENEKVTYPWIAVKCELYDVQVVFQ